MGEGFPVGVPVAVYSVYPQGKHVFGMFDAPPGTRPLEALLGDVAMSAFDFARADRQSFGQGLAIVQLADAGAEVAMAGSHRRALVIDLGGLAMSGERPQDGVEKAALERLLLLLHPGAARGRVGRDRRRGGAQIFADMIEINQVAALIVTGADFRAERDR